MEAVQKEKDGQITPKLFDKASRNLYLSKLCAIHISECAYVFKLFYTPHTLNEVMTVGLTSLPTRTVD